MSHGPESLGPGQLAFLHIWQPKSTSRVPGAEMPAYHPSSYNSAVFPRLPIKKGWPQEDEIPPVHTNPGFTSLWDDGRQNTFFSCYPKALNFIDFPH